jgi:hypothetical protein
MSKFYLFAFIALNLFLTDSIRAQNNTITLNEISVDDKVEIKNNGTMTINISTFYLCDFPAYTQLASLTVESGSLTLTPGSLVVVSGWTIAGNDGELGLYTTPSYTTASAMMDYVEWGSTGHTRSSVAQTAGIWTVGDFVPAFTAGQSISYSGTGNTSASWSAGSQTLGSENGGGCNADGGTLTSESFTFCVGDDVDDFITAGAIELSGNVGTNGAWVLTTEDGVILDIPTSYADINFDDAGAGTCLIWHLSFEDGLTGAEVGLNAADLQGCFSLSNSIAVVRNQPEGGMLMGGPFTFCGNYNVEDLIVNNDIQLMGNSGTFSQWVITDIEGNILGTYPTDSPVNFSEPGSFLFWHLAYEEGLTGAETGLNAFDLSGCFSLSNPIEIFSNQPQGGVLEGGPFVFCVGDGSDDIIADGSITITGNLGINSQWVITNADGVILDLPTSYADINFDEAVTGNYFIWNLSYEDGLMGAEIGLNAADLSGCFSLSNSIEVVRHLPMGGIIEGGPFTFCVGNGSDDIIMDGEIVLSENSGTNGAWVLTDIDGIILDIPGSYSEINFDGFSAGTLFIWYLSYEDGLMGAEIGMSAFELSGCFSLSNPIEIFLNQPIGGVLEGGPFVFCVGDGSDDMIMEGDITLSGNQGANSQWVITDMDGNILDLPASYADVNFDEAVSGNYFIWNLSYEDGLMGAEIGLNAADLSGCFSLSNSIEVVRNLPMGGTIEGGPFTFCVGNGDADNIANGDIVISENSPSENTWVITDADGIIVGITANYSDYDFDNSAIGEYQIWNLSYYGDFTGAEIGMNAADLNGCISLSNPIMITTTQVNGGTISGGPFEFCVSDDVADMIAAGAITLAGNTGSNNAWVITETDGTIIALPSAYSTYDFTGSGAGTCLIWHLTYEDGLIGATIGMNASDLEGCFELSNSITVTKVTSGPLCVISVFEVEATPIAVQLYPNPTSDQVNLQASFGQIESKIIVQIISSTGQLLKEISYNNRSELNAKMDVSAYSTGLYFMVIKTTDRIQNIRFTKE